MVRLRPNRPRGVASNFVGGAPALYAVMGESDDYEDDLGSNADADVHSDDETYYFQGRKPPPRFYKGAASPPQIQKAGNPDWGSYNNDYASRKVAAARQPDRGGNTPRRQVRFPGEPRAASFNATIPIVSASPMTVAVKKDRLEFSATPTTTGVATSLATSTTTGVATGMTAHTTAGAATTRHARIGVAVLTTKFAPLAIANPTTALVDLHVDTSCSSYAQDAAAPRRMA